VRDYVENISLGLPNARLLKQHSLTIVDDDESSWTKITPLSWWIRLCIG